MARPECPIMSQTFKTPDSSSRGFCFYDGAMRTLKASATYFALVFGTGFILGPIRLLWLVPRLVGTFGEHAERYAELMEMPLMLTAIYFAARFIVRRFAPPAGVSPRRYFLFVGLLALACLVAAEMLLGWKLRGLTPLEYFSLRDPISGPAYFLSITVFALLPSRLCRHQT